jgi:hypothetical protein
MASGADDYGNDAGCHDECHGDGDCAPDKHFWQSSQAEAFGRVAGRAFHNTLSDAWSTWLVGAGMAVRQKPPDTCLIFPLVKGNLSHKYKANQMVPRSKYVNTMLGLPSNPKASPGDDDDEDLESGNIKVDQAAQLFKTKRCFLDMSGEISIDSIDSLQAKKSVLSKEYDQLLEEVREEEVDKYKRPEWNQVKQLRSEIEVKEKELEEQIRKINKHLDKTLKDLEEQSVEDMSKLNAELEAAEAENNKVLDAMKAEFDKEKEGMEKEMEQMGKDQKYEDAAKIQKQVNAAEAKFKSKLRKKEEELREKIKPITDKVDAAEAQLETEKDDSRKAAEEKISKLKAHAGIPEKQQKIDSMLKMLQSSTTREYCQLVAKSVATRLQVACGLTTRMFRSFDEDEIIVTVMADTLDLMREADRTNYRVQTENKPFRRDQSKRGSFQQSYVKAFSKAKDLDQPGAGSDGVAYASGKEALEACKQLLKDHAREGDPLIEERKPSELCVDPALWGPNSQRCHTNFENVLKRYKHNEDASPASHRIYLSGYTAFKFDWKLLPLYRHYDASQEQEDPGCSVFRQVDRIRLVDTIIARHLNLPSMKHKDMLTDQFSLHDQTELDILNATWTNNLSCRATLDQPLGRIRDYFGEKIGMYFAWLQFYTNCLFPIAMLGIAVFAVNDTSLLEDLDICKPGGESYICSKGPGLVLAMFGGVVAIWSTLFTELWKRRNGFLNVWWGTVDARALERERAEFVGVYSKDPRTDKKALFQSNPKSYRRKIFIGALIVFLCVLIVITAISLIFFWKYNISSQYLYTVHSVNGTKNTYYEPNPGFNKVMNYELPFESGGTVLVGLANAVQIGILNTFYKIVALQLTNWENHRTFSEFEQHLISKTFLFQFINSYSSFFYISFIKRWTEIGVPPEDSALKRYIHNNGNCSREYIVDYFTSNGTHFIALENDYNYEPVKPVAHGYNDIASLHHLGERPEGFPDEEKTIVPLSYHENSTNTTLEQNLDWTAWSEEDINRRLDNGCLDGNCLAELQMQLISVFLASLLVSNFMELLFPALEYKMSMWIEVQNGKRQRNGLNKRSFLYSVLVYVCTCGCCLCCCTNPEEDYNYEADTFGKCDDQCGRECAGKGKSSGNPHDLSKAEGIKLVDTQVVVYTEAERQAKLKEYDEERTFEDYAEMMIQYGFVTLFVVAFPLTPLLAFINNLLEVHIDALKLTRRVGGFRRPFPRYADSIGPWTTFVAFTTQVSVLTNCVLVIFVADLSCMPKDFFTRCVVFLAAEHGLLAIKMLSDWLVPDIPSELVALNGRNEYANERVIQQMHNDDDSLWQEAREEEPDRAIHVPTAKMLESGKGYHSSSHADEFTYDDTPDDISIPDESDDGEAGGDAGGEEEVAAVTSADEKAATGGGDSK